MCARRLGLFCLALALAACGDDDSGSSAGGDVDASTDSPSGDTAIDSPIEDAPADGGSEDLAPEADADAVAELTDDGERPDRGADTPDAPAEDAAIDDGRDLGDVDNAAPTVSVGADLSITLPDVATLDATADDDGIPGALTLSWSAVSGPGVVTFEDDALADTRATFSQAGSYTLRLTADDGQLSSFDELSVAVGAVPGPLLVLDGETTYQTMRGWEGTTFVGHNDFAAFAEIEEELYDRVVDELGLNRVRLEVRAGSESDTDYWTMLQNGDIDGDTWRANRYATVNDNDDPDVLNAGGFIFSELDDNIDNVVLPLRSRLAERGESLWVNLCYVAFTSQITTGAYIHDDPDEYAEFVLATYEHLDDTYGWVPDSWEILLEPDNVSQWNGTTIGEALVAASARLRAADFAPRFVAPSNTNMGNAVSYFDDLAAVEGAVDDLLELSYHRYGGVSLPNLQAIAQRAETNGLDTAHLEWIGATYQQLHDDLAIGMNSSWSQFVIATLGSDDGGGYYLLRDTEPRVRMGSRTPFLRQYFRWVRRGAVRIGASAAGGFEPLAFVNSGGELTVVVKASGSGTFYVQGLPAGDYRIEYSTVAEPATAVPGVIALIDGQIAQAQIPAAGVLTLYAD